MKNLIEDVRDTQQATSYLTHTTAEQLRKCASCKQMLLRFHIPVCLVLAQDTDPSRHSTASLTPSMVCALCVTYTR